MSCPKIPLKRRKKRLSPSNINKLLLEKGGLKK